MVSWAKQLLWTFLQGTFNYLLSIRLWMRCNFIVSAASMIFTFIYRKRNFGIVNSFKIYSNHLLSTNSKIQANFSANCGKWKSCEFFTQIVFFCCLCFVILEWDRRDLVSTASVSKLPAHGLLNPHVCSVGRPGSISLSSSSIQSLFLSLALTCASPTTHQTHTQNFIPSLFH